MMILKIIGGILIVLGCGGLGFKIAHLQRTEELTLRRLIALLDFMGCELQYRLTPLPQLCRTTAAEGSGILQELFLRLAQELEDQVSPNVERCMDAALSRQKNLPAKTKQCLELLGRSLGRFDIEGQLTGLEAVRQECRLTLSALEKNRDVRLRSYQTLGLCAGAALVILFI